VELWNVFPVERFSEFEKDALQKTDSAARKRLMKLFRNENLSADMSVLGSSTGGSENLRRRQNLSICLSTLYDDILIDIKVHKLWKKRSEKLIWAIYVWILHLLKLYLRPEDFKYTSMYGDYREVYSDKFDSQTEEEQTKLFHTANWMVIFFQLVPPMHNKIMAINVVPKFLEGWEVKYTTGKGMTRATKNRYEIIHIESGMPWTRRDRSITTNVSDKRLKTAHSDPNLRLQSQSASSSSFVPLTNDMPMREDYGQIQPFRCEEDDSFIALLPSIEEMDNLPYSLHEIFVEDTAAKTSHSSSSSSSSSSSNSVTLDTRFLLP